MALSAGTKLGPYEIEKPLGAGGMGEVYRARDTRLERTVAIKVLPSHLSNSPEARQRLDREARAISSLNHPHVCALYDVGHQDGVDFLVMEFLDGQTLGHRLSLGPLLIDEVLKYAVEICEGLEKAHRSGVVHRDLKPGNIMLTKAGVKLMDFGLAKTMKPVRVPTGLTETISFPADQPLTAEGVVVGTFQYMAPEQVEGREADTRSDIFALGAVLYEMVTGKRAFDGKTTTAVMAAVLDRDPEPITVSNPTCPAALDRAVRLCLTKDPEERWQTVHDLKLELQGIRERFGAVDVAVPVHQSNRWTVWGLVAALVLTSAGLVYFASRKPRSVQQGNAPKQLSLQFASPPVAKGLLFPPEGFAFSPYMYALSPDGKKIAFVATSAANPKGLLFVQKLDSLTAAPLQGIEEVAESGYPFWSPDSRSLGFFSAGKLKRVDVDGGVPVTLADAPNAHGGAWGPDGYIVFSKSGFVLAFDSARGIPVEGPAVNELLYRIPAQGGDVESITAANEKHSRDVHRWPSFLSDGHRVLLTCSGVKVRPTDTFSFTGGCVVDASLKDQSPEVSNAPGKVVNDLLLYESDGNLTARQFDQSGKIPNRETTTVAPQIARDEVLATESFSVSPAGVLAYMSDEKLQSRLIRFTRQGKAIETADAPGDYDGVAISPDGQRVATSIARSDSAHDTCLWMDSVDRGTVQRFSEVSEDCANDRFPVWSSDGSKVAYGSTNPPGSIYVKPSSGLGKEDHLWGKIEEGTANVPTDFSPDGKLLLYLNFSGMHGSRLWVHPFADGLKDYELLQSNYPQGEAHFSPDGHWLAYVSEENGRPEVYVVPFPSLSSKTLISAAGGSQPRWRHDGKELFFIAPDGKMMSASVEARSVEARKESFEAGNAQPLFQTQITSTAHAFYQYDVTADGQKFIINARIEQPARPITLIVNWEAELKR